jgi:hypothetical protein
VAADEHSKPIVNIVQIQKDNIDYALRHAIDLLGGINHIAARKERILIGV